MGVDPVSWQFASRRLGRKVREVREVEVVRGFFPRGVFFGG